MHASALLPSSLILLLASSTVSAQALSSTDNALPTTAIESGNTGGTINFSNGNNNGNGGGTTISNNNNNGGTTISSNGGNVNGGSCPGINQDNTACLVGCSLSKPSCFPFCSSSGANQLSTVGSCTTVPFTASDYSSVVYGSMTGGSGAAATGASAGNGGSASPANTGSSSSSKGGAPAVTAGPLVAVGALAFALL